MTRKRVEIIVQAVNIGSGRARSNCVETAKKMTVAIIATISITKGSGWFDFLTRGFFGVATGKAAQISSIERNNADSGTDKCQTASEAFRKNDGEIAAGWH